MSEYRDIGQPLQELRCGGRVGGLVRSMGLLYGSDRAPYWPVVWQEAEPIHTFSLYS